MEKMEQEQFFQNAKYHFTDKKKAINNNNKVMTSDTFMVPGFKAHCFNVRLFSILPFLVANNMTSSLI